MQQHDQEVPALPVEELAVIVPVPEEWRADIAAAFWPAHGAQRAYREYMEGVEAMLAMETAGVAAAAQSLGASFESYRDAVEAVMAGGLRSLAEVAEQMAPAERRVSLRGHTWTIDTGRVEANALQWALGATARARRALKADPPPPEPERRLPLTVERALAESWWDMQLACLPGDHYQAAAEAERRGLYGTSEYLRRLAGQRLRMGVNPVQLLQQARTEHLVPQA